MFGFLKKLFGGDAETNKEAGVQIEQVPYKVEPPAGSMIPTAPVENKVATVNSQPITKESVAVKPKVAKTPAKPKPAKTAAKKPAAKRKPKTTA
jgi:hypothetical protein